MDQKTTRTPEGLSLFLRRHPYLMTVLLCGLLLPFGFADRAKITAADCVRLGVILGAVGVGAVFFFNLGKNLSEKLILSGVSVLTTAAVMLIIGITENKALAIAFIALALAIAVSAFIRLSFTLSDRAIIAVLILLGIAIRFVYVLYTGVGDRQHDVGDFNNAAGHAGYIAYWFQNGLKLPDFDVRTLWQYYHPPLHHWIMAGTLSILTALNVDYATATEALQMLPMLYSSLIMLVSYRIFRLVKLRANPLIAATALVCFHPTFILFSGAFNNDILSVLLMLSAVMWGLRWFRKPVMKNIIPLALCIGPGMMTKLSAWMVAPAVAFLFLYVLIKNIKKPLKTIGQYTVFGVICVPLGVWWQVRNFIKFHIPLTYVPDFGSGSVMYSGDLPLMERLLHFGNGELSYVYGSISLVGAPFDERNPTLGLFKTAMFDECNNSISSLHYPQITATGPILFWLSVVLFLTAFVCFVVMMVKKSAYLSGAERAYFSLLFAVQLVSYYLFCFAYPLSCTYNIRYCMTLIPLCAMGLGLVLQKTKDSARPVTVWFRRILYSLCGAFCAMSYIVYTQVGASM